MFDGLRQAVSEFKELIKRVITWLKSPVFRVHILKIVTLGLAGVLFVTAYMVHVIYADEYLAFQAITTTVDLHRNVTRGTLYDRYSVPLVTNESVSIITYRHIPNTPTSEIRHIAEELSTLIELSELDINSTLTLSDRQNLFFILNEDYVRSLVPDEISQGLDNAGFHQEMMMRITAEHLETLTHEELKVQTLFNRMNQGAGTTANILKENPTDIEVARVIENMIYLPGIDIDVDWRREYPSDLSRSFFGHVSTHQQGIPRDRQAYFFSQGYAANSRVGTSQLERSLQQYLSGFQYRYHLNDGEISQLSTGMPGFQVSITIDSELQLIIEELVADLLIEHRRNVPMARLINSGYVVLKNPHTGEVLAMVGIGLDDEDGDLDVVQRPLGTFQHAYMPGSVVKGASLMMGYHHGTTTVGQVRHDSPINIQASTPLISWQNLGNVNDITAISRSSNIFFFRQAMQHAGVSHSQGGPIINWQQDGSAWDEHRNFFGQLGLGTSTGIELMDETIGMRVTDQNFSNLMHFMIGQSDTYTAMQLAQFISVIATEGYRFQTQVVQNIYMPSYDLRSRQLVRGFEPNLLNRVELTDAQWRNLREGHRQTTQHNQGTAFGAFHTSAADIAGKTGTAEATAQHLDGRPMLDSRGNVRLANNRVFVGYAPASDPQVAISVIIPQAQDQTANNRGPNVANEIARASLEAYFDLQSLRARR